MGVEILVLLVVEMVDVMEKMEVDALGVVVMKKCSDSFYFPPASLCGMWGARPRSDLSGGTTSR